MKEGKAVMKSKIKWVGLVGLALSSLSLFTHFFLARFTDQGLSDYQTSTTIFSWRPIFENARFPLNIPSHRRLWVPVRHLESLHPHANPRGQYPGSVHDGLIDNLLSTDPTSKTNGFIFVRIQGDFHEIRNSISDVVAVARLLNATLVIPEIQSTTSSKGISSDFKSFAYLYNEEQFMTALSKDVKIIKTLPKILKGARRTKRIPLFKAHYQASPYFYLHHVLPVLSKHSVVELVVSNGGCLQATLPPQFEEYQRLRCRVAFHALWFRQEVQELATNILHRLRSPGRPYVAFDPGMTRDVLAYYGCAELFQDVHSELIQHKRSWMIKHGIIRGKLRVDSASQRLNGSCPLMPEEIGILLRAHGYSGDTIVYVSGGEVFGGQRTLIPLHAMFENVVDRTSLSINWELDRIYGHEPNVVNNVPKKLLTVDYALKCKEWKLAGPRPRPLSPPAARPKYPYNIEGWWGWVAESDDEPDRTVMELRTNAHKLLWEAIDYIVCVEADVFIPGFDRDGKGHPNFASLVMGHRLYQSAASRTYQPDRKEVVKLLDQTQDHKYQANITWLKSIRRLMQRSLLDRLSESSIKSKSLSFLSHPVPECSCSRHQSVETLSHVVKSALGSVDKCPIWMNAGFVPVSREKETEGNADEDDLSSSWLFLRNSGGGSDSNGADSNKEELQLEDPEELEGGER